MTQGAGNWRLRASKMLMIPQTPPNLWTRHGARHCWVHRGCALGQASQFSRTVHIFRGVGRRQMRSEDPVFCKWDYHHISKSNLLFLDVSCPRRLNPSIGVSWSPWSTPSPVGSPEGEPQGSSSRPTGTCVTLRQLCFIDWDKILKTRSLIKL